MADDPTTPQGRRPAMRRAVLTLALTILVLDAVAIGAYYWLRIGLAPERTQFLYMVTWTAITFAVLVPQLRRIRRARSGGAARR
ncbi:MAG TPA: hypothetical protein VNA89_15060 [Gemmatimonadaceae bacterium]|nr:hypothetical protein [Gemmatimonadaceae bacterium]